MKFKKIPCWYHVLMWALIASCAGFALGFASGIGNLPIAFGERAVAYWDTAKVYEAGLSNDSAQLYYLLARENCALFEKYQYELLDKGKRKEYMDFCTEVSEELFNKSKAREQDFLDLINQAYGRSETTPAGV